MEREAEAPRAARRFVTATLEEWQLTERADDVALAVTELVTNAVLHARTGAEVVLRGAGGAVRLEVRDNASSLPARAAPDAGAMTGRGVAIVDHLADRWGVEQVVPGKVVWVEFGDYPATSVALEERPPEPVASKHPARLAEGLRRVVLHALPTRLALASNRNLDDIVREFQLMSPEARAALPDALRAAGPLLEASSTRTGRDEAEAAMADGRSVFDLEVLLPPEASSDLLALMDLLDRVNEELRARRLLTPPPSSEVVAFRRWCTHEITRQLAGRPPAPCPFEADASPWDGAAGVEEVRLREARYRSLIEAAELDVWRASATGELVTDMPEWQSYTGQAPGEVLGEGWLDAIAPEHRDRVRRTWSDAIARQSVYECEYPIVSTKGDRRHVLARAVPVREGGVVREWVGTTVDVTDRRAAEEELLLQTRIVETLHEIGISLATTLDLEQILPKLVEATTRITGADFGAFFFNRVDEDGEEYQLVTLHGASMDDFAFGMPRNTKLFAPTFAGVGVVRHEDVTRAAEFGQNPPHNGMPKGHLPVRSYLAVPVVSRTGTVHGGLFFGHAAPGVFTERHERMVVGVAAQASVAIDNALLFDAERRARAAAEDANTRRAVLAEAMERLNASLDLHEVAATLAALVVPLPADWSLVLLDERAAGGAGPIPRDAPHVGARVELRTRQGSGGALLVGRVDGRPFTEDELRLLDEIAKRGAIALDNAQLYSQQRTAALALQQTLLPRERPALRGVDYTIRYLPAAEGAQVGGDFFDLVVLDPTTAAIAVGDVQGKGVQAAAYMGQIRAAMRAYTLAGLGPGAVLQFLDRMWEQQAEVLATCVHAQLDLLNGSGRIASAGHVPPLRFGGGRAPQYLDLRPGPPVGAAVGVYLESIVTLGVDEGLVLFTDGLVEHRRRALHDGLESLARAVEEATARDRVTPDEIADRILADMLDDGHDDDVALIVLRRTP